MENTVNRPQADSGAPQVSDSAEVGIGWACPAMPSLAMAYVPMQRWQGLYSPEVALSRGTLFIALDKPFWGKEAPTA